MCSNGVSKLCASPSVFCGEWSGEGAGPLCRGASVCVRGPGVFPPVIRGVALRVLLCARGVAAPPFCIRVPGRGEFRDSARLMYALLGGGVEL